MTLDKLLAAYRHRPFRPLILKTESGEQYPVSHPEGMTTSPDGEIVGVILANHDFVLIEVDAITEVLARPSRQGKPHRSAEE